jgi:hypothetical protein
MSATLAEMAETAVADPNDAIGFIIDNVDSDDDRRAFLSGLTERIIEQEAHPSDEAHAGTVQWVATWLVSLALARDDRFVAADVEASELIAAGKVGDGISGADLRARYRH